MPRPLHERITPPSSLTPEERTNFLALLERSSTEAPQESDLVEISQILDRFPELWHKVGSLTAAIQDDVITRIAPRPLMHRAMDRIADDMRRSLSLPTDTGTEQMLIEHCVTAYLIHYELLDFFNTEKLDEYTPAELQYLDRRVTVSENRYLKSIETLARVRNLALPLLQIHIAGQQLNITNPALPTQAPPPRIIDQPPPQTD